MTNDWIAFKERAPTEADLPLVAISDTTGNAYAYAHVALHQDEPWTHWQPFRPPEPPKPQVFLRHHDGREEEIEGPVYTFLEVADDGDEYFSVTKLGWIKAVKGLTSDSVASVIRRRIA